MEYGYVAIWLAAYLVLGLAALPVAAAVFPRFHDRGAAFAIPLALAVLGLVGYLVGHVAFGWVALVAGVAVLVVASFRAGAFVEIDRRAYAEAAAVFSVAFLFVVAFRAFDPAVYPLGGEKFLDFGLLKSLLRSPQLPPEDMWFAGEPVQYYYGGHVLAALLATLTFTPGAYAYNLALAGFYATLVTAAYGLAGAVAAGHGGPRRLAAGLGAFFAGIASNLQTTGQVLLWLVPGGLARAIVGGTGATPDALRWSPTQFSYWSASRVIPGTINEFPLFAWLNGDMHAHMTSTGFLLLTAAVLYSYWQTPEEEIARRRLLVFGVVPPLAGLIAVVNTWSFPAAALGLPALTLAFAPASPRTLFPDRVAGALPSGEELTLRGELGRDGTALAATVGTLVVAVLWVTPFWLATASGRSIATFPPRSGLGGLLLVHGAFLLAFGAYLARHAGAELERPGLVVAGLAAFVVAAVVVGAAALALFLPLLLAAWGLLRLRRDVGFEALLVIAGAGIALLVEFAYVLEPQYGPGNRLNTVFKTYMQVWILWAPAAGVALSRLATTGVATTGVASTAGVTGGDADSSGATTDDATTDDRTVSDGRSSRPSWNAATWRYAGRVLAAFLVFTTALYAGFALPLHFERGSPTSDEYGPTLHATAFVEVRHSGEAPAIRRIDRLEGQPTIVTAAPAGYYWQPSDGRGASAPASLTGVPTVAGWYHERQYRSPEAYQQRVAAVEAIYTSDDRALQRQLLATYGVRYVYVGPAERARYGTITTQEVQGVSVEGQYGDVVLLEVDQSQLQE